MEDTHTGARVERVKSYVSLCTVLSLYSLELHVLVLQSLTF